MIRPGEPWGGPATGPADVRGGGDDAALAALVAAHPGARVAFAPDGSDLARAVGLAGPPRGDVELVLDALDVATVGLAVNLLVSGVAPDRLRAGHRRHAVEVDVDGRRAFGGRATTVVIANGQFRRGADLVPRGHPGDGRLEVHVFALAPGQRATLRRRLPGGGHLPHPALHTAAGRQVRVEWDRARPLEVDGARRGRRAVVEAQIVPGAYRLLL